MSTMFADSAAELDRPLTELIPSGPLTLPPFAEISDSKLAEEAEKYQKLIDDVSAKRLLAVKAVEAAAKLTTSKLVAGDGKKVIAKILEAIEAEGDLRDQLPTFVEAVRASAKRAHSLACEEHAKAERAIDKKLRTLGYSDLPGTRGWIAWFPGCVSRHPSVLEAKERCDVLSGMSNLSTYLAGNSAEIERLKNQLRTVRRRAVQII